MVGTAVLSSALAPKPKLQTVDRGRLDDLRFTTVEEGAFKPLAYGRRARLAGNIRWGTKTKEFITSTPGRQGGKGGGGRQAEPPANNFTYKKSFAVLVCGNRIRRYRRMWEGPEVIYNADGSDSYEDFFEAELAELSGTAQVGSGTSYSGGRAVATGIAGTITFRNVRARSQGSHVISIFYREASGVSVTLTVNGSSQSVSLPATGAAVGRAEASATLDLGADNLIAILYAGLGSTIIDRIQVRKTGDPAPDETPVIVGVVDDGGTYPTDLDIPRPFYNLHPVYDGQGVATGVLTGGGQSPFEFYTGTEDQLQSPTIVAAEGAANVPAWRGDSYVVFDSYLLKNGRLDNMVFEVEPDIQDLAEVAADLYKQDGRAGDDELDFSELAGTVVEGFIVHTRDQLSTWIDQLQVWYNFDVVPVDGKIKAVKRGASPSFTLTEDDLYAHREGAERPAGAVRRVFEDPADVPGAVDVLYVDPSTEKEFHTGGQHAQVQVGDSYDQETLAFALVGSPDEAQAVGRRWLDLKELEAKPMECSVGPAHRHLIPTDVGELVLPRVTHTVRVVGAQAELQGLTRLKLVPERASLYTQKGFGALAPGRETPAVEFPANTALVLADVPPLRREDVGDLFVLAGGCGRGAGAWKGFVVSQENRVGEYERRLAVEKPATIGVVESVYDYSGEAADFDRTTQLRVKLLYGSLESRPEEDLLDEFVNVAVYGKGGRFEVIQFAQATPEAPTFPYVAQYLVSGIWRGRVATEYAMGSHEAGDWFMLVDGDAVKKLNLDPQDLNQTLKFKGVTFGQAEIDAPETEITVAGNSRKHPAPANLRGSYDSADNLLVECDRRILGPHNLRDFDPAPVNDEGVEFVAEVRAAGVTTGEPVRGIPFAIGSPQPAALISYRSGAASKFDSVDKNTLSATGTAVGVRSRALQEISRTNNFVEATLRATGDGSATLVLAGAQKDWRNLGFAELFDFSVGVVGGVSPGVYVYPVGGSSINVGPYSSGDDARLQLALVGGQVLVFRDHAGPGTPPLYAFPVAPVFPLAVILDVVTQSSGSGTAEAREVILTTAPEPKVVYTAEERGADFGGVAPATVNVRVFQRSAHVGDGHYVEKEL
jgi:Putative phage tail protein